MTLGQHLACTAAAAAALLPFRKGEEVLVFASASILIDVDHYLFYILRRRRFDVRGMFRYFNELQPLQKTIPYIGVCIFHTVDFLLVIALFALKFSFFRPVLAGLVFHHLLDILDLRRKGVPFIRAFFLVEHMFRRRHNGYPYY